MSSGVEMSLVESQYRVEANAKSGREIVGKLKNMAQFYIGPLMEYSDDSHLETVKPTFTDNIYFNIGPVDTRLYPKNGIFLVVEKDGEIWVHGDNDMILVGVPAPTETVA
ncbi:hypothetical protein HYV12_03760 [Candidatus Dojkabacteria bacterium]|nr:hypothetical protein [Candidatus Dojkabacteria bacterium]